MPSWMTQILTINVFAGEWMYIPKMVNNREIATVIVKTPKTVFQKSPPGLLGGGGKTNAG